MRSNCSSGREERLHLAFGFINSSSKGAFFAFKKVFWIMSSSVSWTFEASFQPVLSGLLAVLFSRVSRLVSWWKKFALISRSGRREFKNSRVLYNVQLNLCKFEKRHQYFGRRSLDSSPLHEICCNSTARATLASY